MNRSAFHFRLVARALALTVGVGLGACLGAGLAPKEEGCAPQLITLEQEALDAVQAKDLEALRRLTAPDYRGILYPEGPEDREQMLRNVADFALTAYTLTDVKTLWLSADAGVVSYTVVYQGTYQGQPLSEKPLFASAVWARRDGRWVCVLYQETPTAREEEAVSSP